ncbi:hypothetical protein M211_0698 [Acinetobacter lactucae]|nr:hypothetical protein M211_0698 [Acinetobacter lactucae]
MSNPSKTELAGQKNARKLKGRDAMPMKQHTAIMKLKRRKSFKKERNENSRSEYGISCP